MTIGSLNPPGGYRDIVIPTLMYTPYFPGAIYLAMIQTLLFDRIVFLLIVSMGKNILTYIFYMITCQYVVYEL